jgi:hypothetical protein
VDIMRAAVQCAKHVIGHINKAMPRTLGDGLVHISQFDTVFTKETPLQSHPAGEPSDVETAIGKYVDSYTDCGHVGPRLE